MRIEVALSAADGVGEGPFWDEAEQALWWVDIAGRGSRRRASSQRSRRRKIFGLGGAGCLRELIVAVRALPVDTKATRLITEVRKLKPQSCQ